MRGATVVLFLSGRGAQPSILQRSIYAIVILLSLIALGLALTAPADLLKVHSVYQGF